MGFLMELPELEGRVQSNGSETDVTAMVAEASMIVSQIRERRNTLDIQKSAYLERQNKAVGLKAVGVGENEEENEKGPSRQPYIFQHWNIKKVPT
jgi:hypothetical protein